MTPELLGTATLVLLAAIYFFPVLYAVKNHHPDGSLLAIILINTLAGWTVAGWFVAAFLAERTYPAQR